MGFFKKIVKKAFSIPKKIVDKAIDTVVDVGKAIVNIAISPFTGGFDIPDISVDTTTAIDQATTVDFAPGNKAIPVRYGTYVETGVKNIFVATAGDKNQYLYTAGVIGLGMSQADHNGSKLWNMLIDDAIVDVTESKTTGSLSNYTHATDVRSAMNSVVKSSVGGFPRFAGYGGQQPAIYEVVTGRFKNRVQFQLFDGSDDQPASSLLKESGKWDDSNRLRGVQYVAMRFLWTQDEIKDENGDNLTNPFSGLPRVVVMCPGRNTPRLVKEKDTSPGYEFDTDTNPIGGVYQVDEDVAPASYDISFNETFTIANISVTTVNTTTEYTFRDLAQDSTSGSGTGARFNIVIDHKNAPNTATITLRNHGQTGYQPGDTITISQSNLDTAVNSDLVITVGAVTSPGIYDHTKTRMDGYDVSGNPVEHLLDYMLNDRYGAGIDINKIDKDSFINAAVACGRSRPETTNSFFATNLFSTVFSGNATYPAVKLNRIVGKDTDSRVYDLTYNNTPYYRQYTIDTGGTHLQNINRMLSSIGGIMPFVNGKFKLIIENAGTTDNSFDIPSVADLKGSSTFTFTDDNIVDGITFSGGALENTFNQIKLDYTDIENRSQSNSVVWPLKTDTQYSTFKRQDNDVDLIGSVTNAGIVNGSHAAHYAKVLVNKSRQQQNISFKTTESATNLVPGDIIRVNSAVLSIDHLFRIQQITLDQYGDIEISAFRHYPEAYNFDDANLFDQIISFTNFITGNVTKPQVISPAPNVFRAPQGLTTTRKTTLSLNLDKNKRSDLLVAWKDGNINAGSNSYEVQLKKNTDAEDAYESLGITKNQEMLINTASFNLGQKFNLRVRAISQNGTFSSFTSTTFTNTPFLGGEFENNVWPYPKKYMDDSLSGVSSGSGAGTNVGTVGTIKSNDTGEI
jgi:hypothetical protein